MAHPPGYNLDKRGEHVGAKSEAKLDSNGSQWG